MIVGAGTAIVMYCYATMPSRPITVMPVWSPSSVPISRAIPRVVPRIIPWAIPRVVEPRIIERIIIPWRVETVPCPVRTIEVIESAETYGYGVFILVAVILLSVLLREGTVCPCRGITGKRVRIESVAGSEFYDVIAYGVGSHEIVVGGKGAAAVVFIYIAV